MTRRLRIWWAALSYAQVRQRGQLAASATSRAMAVGMTVFALFAKLQELLKSLMERSVYALQGLELAR